MGWEVYPKGLSDILLWLNETQTGGTLPLFVTENGMAWADTVSARDGAVQDQQRVDYFDGHLAACLDAVRQGVPLKGYFAWSLLDNYEWALGYGPRFGLVHVDYDTQVRTPKASYRAFQTMLTGQ
jgi:beta-glucosidase